MPWKLRPVGRNLENVMRFRPKTTDSTSFWLLKSIQKSSHRWTRTVFLFLLGKRIAVSTFVWRSINQLYSEHSPEMLHIGIHAFSKTIISRWFFQKQNKLLHPTNRLNAFGIKDWCLLRTSRIRWQVVQGWNVLKKQNHQHLQRRYHRHHRKVWELYDIVSAISATWILSIISQSFPKLRLTHHWVMTRHDRHSLKLSERSYSKWLAT